MFVRGPGISQEPVALKLPVVRRTVQLRSARTHWDQETLENCSTHMRVAVLKVDQRRQPTKPQQLWFCHPDKVSLTGVMYDRDVCCLKRERQRVIIRQVAEVVWARAEVGSCSGIRQRRNGIRHPDGNCSN
jgi:hypothetical protein